jgi:hypothetical protein
VELYYEGGKVSQTLDQPITIAGPGKITIPIKQANYETITDRQGFSLTH